MNVIPSFPFPWERWISIIPFTGWMLIILPLGGFLLLRFCSLVLLALTFLYLGLFLRSEFLFIESPLCKWDLFVSMDWLRFVLMRFVSFPCRRYILFQLLHMMMISHLRDCVITYQLVAPLSSLTKILILEALFTERKLWFKYFLQNWIPWI